MGLGDWWKRLFPRTDSSNDTVLFYDVEAEHPVRIPKRELRPGAIQVQVQGIDEVVWILPDNVQQGPLRHEPFDDEVREMIEQIQATFAEHYALSFDQWEEGFRRDADPAQEIAVWLHAGEVYRQFAADEPSADRRQDIYRCIAACLTASHDTVWNVLEPQALSREEAKRIVDCYFNNDDA
ncbi:hypothetical protein [Blastopirellula retiformator]|uniref:Uncharacterized protein n=1 Tax=Blastopirellula retiformator TaxID=2527970 RepID=A0A5C5V226_9BACT|nr:hypothetical protein [Blastopirellula retiformator]TWT32626.1 hypothetical protein Enr8_24310 [Blastopirellula retiformator]